MAFTQAQFAEAVESCPEVQRLRAIEEAAREYRDALKAVRIHVDSKRYDAAADFRKADAEENLFRLLDATP